MDILVEFILVTMSVIDIVISMNIILDKFNRSDRQNFFFALMSFCNAITCVSFGLMVHMDFKTGADYARIIAVMGIVGFCVFCCTTYLCWTKNKMWLNVAFIGIWSLLGLIVSSLIAIDPSIEFVESSIGYTFTYGFTTARTLLWLYEILTLCILLVVTVIVFRRRSKSRVRRIMKGMLGCDLVFSLFVIADILMPHIGKYFVPGNAVLLFIANVFIFQCLIFTRRNRITVKNMSEFVYYNVEAPILICDEDCRLVIINKFAEEFFGEDEEFIGHEISEFFDIKSEDVKDRNFISSALCSKNSAICNISVNRLDDSYNEVLGYMLFVIDQTEQILALRQVEESRKIAEDASKAKSEFLANMSHEIRTPINVILGMNEMILRETKDRFLVKYASDIKTASNSLLSLVNDILDFSKIESGKMEIFPVQYDSNNLFFEIISTMSFKAKEKGLSFIFNIDSKLPCQLFGDDVHIRQIINNLLSNAIKYTSKGKVLFDIEAHAVDKENVDVQIAVTDTGCGIKKEDISKLFDAFTRVDEVHNRTIEGTGLGLKITHELLTMMGGVLNVKSTYGKGSTFSCSIRQKIINHEPIGDFNKYYEDHQNTTYVYTKSFEAPLVSVLVVDDNLMNLNVVDNLLRETRMNVVTVLSGKEAVESARKQKYDIIFMDHMMPEMDGFEAYTAIREDEEGLSKDAPIVAMTANAIAGARQMYLNYGFAEYISKPIAPDKLNDIILRFVSPDKIVQVNTKVDDIECDDKESRELSRIEQYLEERGINVIAGLRNVNNKVVNYQETLRMFSKSYESMRDELKAHLDNDESKEYGIKAHALKSNARIIGADELASICYMHEMAGKESRLDDARKGWDEMVEKWVDTIKIVDEYLREIDLDREELVANDENLNTISDEELAQKVDEIKELIDDYEHHEAKEKIELLMDYKIPAELKEAVKKAYKCLEKIDYDNAAKAMENV